MKTWLCLTVALLCSPVSGAQPSADDYEHSVKTVLRARCYACHGALKQESGLRLDTVGLMRTGGSSGPAVTPDDVEASEILQRVTASDDSIRMPPEGPPLEAHQIQSIRNWIRQGAPAPPDELPEEDPDRHWSFQPVRRPALPETLADAAPSDNPLDVLIAGRLQQKQLTAAQAAPANVLLRRLYLDLIGMPPSREELVEFLADPSPQAWNQTVDRLLDDPRYGERWGRHWMDIWRYSDWYGRRHVPDVWNSAPQIWRWRDWIVNSLNEDTGYDAMLHQMLAGDEIDPENDQAGYATGFLIRNWYALNPNDWMRNTVEHTGKAFLGLTFNCAHCHDHKYDPIRHEDYFRLRAYFEPLYIRQDRVPGEADPGPFQDYVYSGPLRRVVRLGAVRVFDKEPDAPTWFYTGGDERNRDADRGAILPGVPDFLTRRQPEILPVSLPVTASHPGLRPALLEALREEQRALRDQARQKLLDLQPEDANQSQSLIAALNQANEEFQQAAAMAVAAGDAAVISGQQSLLLDATKGRRILLNSLPDVATLPPGTIIAFRLRLLSDAHFNFQLAKDTAKGLTAAYVAFQNGTIVSYRPGSFQEFQVGQYRFTDGQVDFDVRLKLSADSDECQLSVHCTNDQAVLVAGTAVARNAWDPTTNSASGLFLDARTGCRAMVDDLTISSPPQTPETAANSTTFPEQLSGDLLHCDFELPDYRPAVDVVGRDGWNVSPIGQAPATSLVTNYGDNATLRELDQQRQIAQRAVEMVSARRRSLELQLEAAEAALISLPARAAADRAKYDAATSDGDSEAHVQTLAEAASRAERRASLLAAESRVLAATAALAEIERLPSDQADRAAQLESSTKALAEARQQLQSLQAPGTQLKDESSAAEYTPLGPAYPTTSTGRRKALALWMTSPDNPLTARVAVNHIWGRHFHVPIVTTVADFGRNGARPSHPELLDWLAAEFMESGWSMKHMHRLILTSDVWRRQSFAEPSSPQVQTDPQNRWLWRMNPGRMEAEVVRDSLLACAGLLDLTQGGQELENDQALTTFRRSLYYSCNPENDGKSELGKLFDAPDPGDCYRRSQTIIPQQALALTNSQLVHLAATRIADRVIEQTSPKDSGDLPAILEHLFLSILSRQPTAAELAICTVAYEDQCRLVNEISPDSAGDPPGEGDRVPAAAAHNADPRAHRPLCRAAVESVIRALLNHNDFITIR